MGSFQRRPSSESQDNSNPRSLFQTQLVKSSSSKAGQLGMLRKYAAKESSYSLRILTLFLACSMFMIAIVQLWQSGKPNSYEGPVPSRLLLLQHRSPGLELLLDLRPFPSEDQLVREIEDQLPSLPLAYWKNATRLAAKPGETGNCTPRYPSFFELEFSNVYWQTFRSKSATFQLFGAFFDERRLLSTGPVVRVIGMTDGIVPQEKTFCQLWFEDEREPVVVEVLEYKYIWYSERNNYEQGTYHSYLIACKVPESHRGRGPPASVSLVERRCEMARNNLRIIYNKPERKKPFAVCVKGLDYPYNDLSAKLVEWIELIGLMGADKIFLYQLQVHPNMTKVMQYYQRLGRIHVTPLTLPGGQPNFPALQHMYIKESPDQEMMNEVIPLNDCFYKHMYEYEYIVLLDLDEVIMPVQDTTWNELMSRVKFKALQLRNETPASYSARNVYYLDDLLDSHGFFKEIPRLPHTSASVSLIYHCIQSCIIT